MEFQTTLLAMTPKATALEVPEPIVSDLGAGKRPDVVVTINGHAYRSKVGVMGGRFLIPVSAEVRAAAGIAAGEEIVVSLDLDTAPREVETPEDLAALLAADTAAGSAYAALSYSNRKRIAASITEAKTAETRQRRLEKVMAELRG